MNVCLQKQSNRFCEIDLLHLKLVIKKKKRKKEAALQFLYFQIFPGLIFPLWFSHNKLGLSQTRQMWNVSAGFQGHGIIPYEIPGTEVKNFKHHETIVAIKNYILASVNHNRCTVSNK